MTEAAATQPETEYAPGTFCWIELGTSDSDAAKKFYAQLFGWDYTDSPIGPSMVYTTLKRDGQDVAGLYQITPDMAALGIPSHWMSYVSVANADESVAKAKQAGGTVLNGPFDVFTLGRMAVLQDPAGAVFAIWQAGTYKGTSEVNVTNSFCWNELATNDTQKAGEFYTNLFGWTREDSSSGPIEYTVFKNGDRGAGGMYKITPEMGPIPSHWLVYFAVDDCDAKVQRATELGAKVIKPADDIPGVGRFAILLDPQGAAFAIINSDLQSSEQRGEQRRSTAEYGGDAHASSHLDQQELERLSTKIREVLTNAAFAQQQITKNQVQIEKLKAETRAVLTKLREG